jgi:histidinol phosphatase-like enzyme
MDLYSSIMRGIGRKQGVPNIQVVNRMTQRRAFRYAPLPGTEQPTRAIFVKRWGTLLAAREAGPCNSFDAGLFMPGAVDALFRAAQSGWQIYLIGNEEDVAFGRVSDEEWAAFESALLNHLTRAGIHVTRCYAGLDHPAGKQGHRRKSVFLLPDTGLFYHAAQHDGIDLDQSWVIGDATPELAAGERAGCHVARVMDGAGPDDLDLHVDPELRASSLTEVLESLTSALVRARR